MGIEIYGSRCARFRGSIREDSKLLKSGGSVEALRSGCVSLRWFKSTTISYRLQAFGCRFFDLKLLVVLSMVVVLNRGHGKARVVGRVMAI